eukprot:8406444-Pyramimonas_sp.AAC.1
MPDHSPTLFAYVTRNVAVAVRVEFCGSHRNSTDRIKRMMLPKAYSPFSPCAVRAQRLSVLLRRNGPPHRRLPGLLRGRRHTEAKAGALRSQRPHRSVEREQGKEATVLQEAIRSYRRLYGPTGGDTVLQEAI